MRLVGQERLIFLSGDMRSATTAAISCIPKGQALFAAGIVLHGRPLFHVTCFQPQCYGQAVTCNAMPQISIQLTHMRMERGPTILLMSGKQNSRNALAYKPAAIHGWSSLIIPNCLRRCNSISTWAQPATTEQNRNWAAKCETRIKRNEAEVDPSRS